MAKSILAVATESFTNPKIAKKFKTLDKLVDAVRQNRCKDDAVKAQGKDDAVVWGTTVAKVLSFHGVEIVVVETTTEDTKPSGIAKKS